MNKIILYKVSPKPYEAKIIKILRKVKRDTIIYVSVTKDCMQLSANFKKSRLDLSRFFFIDCIAKQHGRKTKAPTRNTIFTSNPESLTEISLAISEAMKRISGGRRGRTLVLDSLNSLLVHNNSILVSKFSNFIINNLRAHQMNGIFIVIDTKMLSDLIAQIGSACDEVKKI